MDGWQAARHRLLPSKTFREYGETIRAVLVFLALHTSDVERS
jgi:hypothetical protein